MARCGGGSRALGKTVGTDNLAATMAGATGAPPPQGGLKDNGRACELGRTAGANDCEGKADPTLGSDCKRTQWRTRFGAGDSRWRHRDDNPRRRRGGHGPQATQQ